MRAPKTARARGWFALTIAFLLLGGAFGTVQGLTGGGWWGFILWAVLYGVIAALAFIVPRVMVWIDSGEES